MKTAAALAEHLGLLARWMDRSERVMSAVLAEDDTVLSISRGYAKRSGCSSRAHICLEEILQLDGELLINPCFGAPLQQHATCPGDDSQWLISVFKTPDQTRLILGTLEHESLHDAEARHDDVMTADLFAYQRHLTRGNRRLRTAHEEAERELAVDTLTGVASRRALQASARAAVEAARRDGTPLSVILCDIDKFKSVNDTHGHAAGDEVLKAFGGVLAATCRDGDLPARPGGEEFTILAIKTDLEGAAALAERLRQAVEACVVPAIGRAVTASFGVAQWIPGESIKDTEERGDAALYRAKKGGRNQVMCADEAALREQGGGDAPREALERQQLTASSAAG